MEHVYAIAMNWVLNQENSQAQDIVSIKRLLIKNEEKKRRLRNRGDYLSA